MADQPSEQEQVDNQPADKPSEPVSNQLPEQGSKKKEKVIKAVGVIVIIALLAIIAVLLWNKNKADEPKRNVVTHNNVEEVASEMMNQEYVEPGYYSVSMTTTWNFETGDAVSEDAYVENKAENTHTVYFDVFLAEDEENPILQSPLIPRGEEMTNIALDKPLDAGTYDCVMVYHLVDEDQNTVSTLRVELTINVEK